MENQDINKNNFDNIALSSRIRLARNISEKSYPWKMDEIAGLEVAGLIRRAALEKGGLEKYGFEFKFVSEMNKDEKADLLANHLMSIDLIKNPKNGGILISGDKTVSILVNEEDHLRIQTVLPGFDLGNAWQEADTVDDLMEESVSYAFDRHYGYLTACPSNIGTGMRASVMLHLPALAFTKYIKRVFDITNTIGLTVRGLYGEGTSTEGDIYQISNQVTIGRTEADIIGDLEKITMHVMAKERQAREYLVTKQKTRTEDRIFRAMGILSNARLMSRIEGMKLLSLIRLGVDIEIVKNVEMDDLDTLTKELQSIENNDAAESAKEIAMKVREFFK
ncbi:MAG: protein arginine kinase [Peptostreptococcaceae bacterium]|nr:protein arginine kinase [Peptostreptococcaceae bacterium]